MSGLTIVLPCFNAEMQIVSSLRRLDLYLADHQHDQIILVDDGSSDATVQTIEQVISGLKHGRRFRCVQHARNLGKGGAVKTGLAEASTELVCYTDIDLAYDLENLDDMRRRVPDKGLIVANRVHPDSVYCIRPSQFGYIAGRHRASRVMNALLSLLLRLPIHDVQAGLKLGHRDVFNGLAADVRQNRFSFDLELMALAKVREIPILESPVRYRSQDEATSVRFFMDALLYLRDLLKVCLRYYGGRYR